MGGSPGVRTRAKGAPVAARPTQHPALAATAMLTRADVLGRGEADVARLRERNRQRRLRRAFTVMAPLAVWLWSRQLAGRPVRPGWPSISDSWSLLLPQLAIVAILGVVILLPLLIAGRSPHVRFRPSEIDVSFDDVKGMGVVLEEVV